ncbi:hypothetical protein CEXT_254881 [Caerostris extrusa]|uniref:Uncharacterized protein n=1 Tax=Caerostris extrusa TaxID=172846 RepID=A0AAV4UW40_CAEEX|nr:hypothetical protein CEXT_254881 [Caerostris extrusa]
MILVSTASLKSSREKLLFFYNGMPRNQTRGREFGEYCEVLLKLITFDLHCRVKYFRIAIRANVKGFSSKSRCIAFFSP